MGSEDLHHRRKMRNIDSLTRKQGKRSPYDIVVIVCEGRETEPNYLKGLCEELKLNSANIEVLGIGADPLTIVNFALDKCRKLAEREGNDDPKGHRVYCVFDKDQHSNYQDAIDKINSHQKYGIPIFAITSVPCFEYWLLLHFVDSAKPYELKGKKTAGKQLKSELKLFIENFNEADRNIFKKTKSNIQTAIVRAKRINKTQKKNCTDNPSTNFYELVEYLMQIKIN